MRLIALAPLALISGLGLSACHPDAPLPNPSQTFSQTFAQASPCPVPEDLTPAPPYDIPAAQVVADVPTAFNMLAVSWSPEACRSGKDYPDPVHQCAQNAFGLTLHGLWPNGAEGKHPRYCAAPGPAIDLKTVRQHFCMTPSPTLLQHEWAAHGTCGWTSPEDYFAQAATLWNSIRRPDLEAIPAKDLTAGSIRDAFATANPTMPRNSIYVATTDGWFREVRICYSTAYQPIACPLGLGSPDDMPLKLAPRGVHTPS